MGGPDVAVLLAISVWIEESGFWSGKPVIPVAIRTPGTSRKRSRSLWYTRTRPRRPEVAGGRVIEKCHQVRTIEACVDGIQIIHRPQQQPCADHDDNGKRGFSNDEHAANVTANHAARSP